MAQKREKQKRKPSETEMMDLIKKHHGCFGDVGFKTLTINKVRYNMGAVRETLESLCRKKKLRKEIHRDVFGKIRVRTYYIPAMRDEGGSKEIQSPIF